MLHFHPETRLQTLTISWPMSVRSCQEQSGLVFIAEQRIWKPVWKHVCPAEVLCPLCPLCPLSSLSSHTCSSCLLQTKLALQKQLTKTLTTGFLPSPLTQPTLCTVAANPLALRHPVGTTTFIQTPFLGPALFRPAPGPLRATHTPIIFSPYWRLHLLSARLQPSLSHPTGPPGATWQSSHTNYAANLTHNGASAQVLMLSRPPHLRALHIIMAKIPHHAFFLLLLLWPKRRTDPRAVAGARRPVLIAIGQYGLDIIV